MIVILKRNLFYSFILGFVSAWFLIFILKNPYIEEFRELVFLEKVVWWLLLILPLFFLTGILLAHFLAKTAKIIYQAAKFVETGILNTLIDFGILNLLIWLTGITAGLTIAPLNAVAFFCAASNSYFWNKFWTFEKNKKVTVGEFSQFLTIAAVGMVINTGIVVAGTTFILPLFGLSPGAWANIMKIIATFISMIWDFSGYKFIVFKK